jgi:tetratricopeptide (TPR) repeat protein
VHRYQRLVPFLIAVLTFAAFVPALWNDFVNWDDLTNLVQNTDYRGLGWTHLKWMWTTNLMARYLPITWMTFGLDYKIWGMDPFGYHLTSILFHTLNAALFYFLALAIFRIAIPPNSAETRSRIPLGALVAALVFALHPLRAESVAWATERRDVVSGTFYLLAVLAYLRACSNCPSQPIVRKYYWACVASFVLAILSKEIALTLPAVLLILDVYPLKRLGGARGRWIGPSVRTVWLEKIPFLAFGIASALVTLYLTHEQGLSMPLSKQSWFSRIAMAVYSLWFYLWKTVAPLHLSAFYPLTPYKIDPREWPFQVSLAAVLGITGATVLLRRRLPALLAVWLAYSVTLLPVLGIVYKGEHIVADRYSYLACLGWAILGGWLVMHWNGWRSRTGKAIVMLAGLAILGLAGLTWRQVQVWRDSETLWAHALSIETSALAHTSMGAVQLEHGYALSAMEHFQQAIAIKPDYWIPHYDLGSALVSRDRWDDAVAEYRIALTLDNVGPNAADIQNDLGYALMMLGKPDEAVSNFLEALKVRPTFGRARRNLERALAMKDNPPQSRSAH